MALEGNEGRGFTEGLPSRAGLDSAVVVRTYCFAEERGQHRVVVDWWRVRVLALTWVWV